MTEINNSYQELRLRKKQNKVDLTHHKYADSMYCDYCEKYIPFEEIYWLQCKTLVIPRCPNTLKKRSRCKGIKLRSGSANLKTRRKFTQPTYIE
jgi:hypothetical protein